MPDEVWMEVHDIVQETGIKTISMEKKWKKAKWLYKKALEIAVKRREAKSKEECRVPKISRRDKKAFLSDHCKEIEENHKMGRL